MAARSWWLACAGVLGLTACGLTIVGTADVDAGSDAAAPPIEDAAPVDGDAGEAGVLLRWNIGGPLYAGSATTPGPWAEGTVGKGPCGPSTYANAVAIKGTTDDVLYQTEVWGNPLVCAIGDGELPAGTYRVSMYFAEIYFGAGCPGAGGKGSRVFAIDLEGKEVDEDIDLYERIGCAASTGTADAGTLMLSHDVDVTDGTLDIAMPAKANNAKLSALEVRGPL